MTRHLITLVQELEIAELYVDGALVLSTGPGSKSAWSVTLDLERKITFWIAHDLAALGVTDGPFCENFQNAEVISLRTPSWILGRKTYRLTLDVTEDGVTEVKTYGRFPGEWPPIEEDAEWMWDPMLDQRTAEDKPGYHLRKIKKARPGSSAKIREELEEFEDALDQDAKLMAVVELSDMIGAISLWLEKQEIGLGIQDLMKMSKITRRAFENGHR